MTQNGIEILLGSIKTHPIWLELSIWHIGTLHVSSMTQSGIEVLLGSLIALPILLDHSMLHIKT